MRNCGEVTDRRDTTWRWLKTGDPAIVRRNSDGTSSVAAHPSWRTMHGNRGCFTAAGTARSSGPVQRVVGAACEEVIGFVVVEEFRSIRLSENNRAGSSQSCDSGRIRLGDMPQTEAAAT